MWICEKCGENQEDTSSLCTKCLTLRRENPGQEKPRLGFWKRLFSSKESPNQPKAPTQQKANRVMSRTIDVRNDAERATEHRAQTPLEVPIEGIADTLTGLSLALEAIHNKSAAVNLLPQLEGLRNKPGGISKQEKEALIVEERAKLDEAEKAIRAIIPVLEARSIFVATPDDCNHHMADLGRQLNEKGGLKLMELVAYRCRARGGRLVYIQAAWDGIGDWKW